MLSFLPPFVRGVIAATLLGLNTVFWCFLLFLFALVKFACPATRVRAAVDRLLNAIATSWIACNSGWMRLTQRAQWDVAGFEGLEYRGWYMVSCNHQSWVDIFVLQHLLNRRIPMLKFFLKHQLIYVPIMGPAWWALDFPFMRRHADSYLRSHPEKRFEDLETTRRACEKFALVPTSVMNFAEGTRFTKQKHRAQRSPYRHLLKPRAGALALALSVLGEKFRSLLDVTIVYPDGTPSFWNFLCGRMPKVVVRARRRPIPAEFAGGSYADDAIFRKTIQHWLQELWSEKDEQIELLLEEGRGGPGTARAAGGNASGRGRWRIDAPGRDGR